MLKRETSELFLSAALLLKGYERATGRRSIDAVDRSASRQSARCSAHRHKIIRKGDTIMSTFVIDPDQIDEHSLGALILTLNQIASSKNNNGEFSGQNELTMTELLKIVGFDREVNERIRKARGSVKLRFKKDGTGSAVNDGVKIEEDLPGTGGFLSLILETAFRCQIEIYQNAVYLSAIVGLFANPPILPRMAINRIEIMTPNKARISY
jgi:hypothetical protein